MRRLRSLLACVLTSAIAIQGIGIGPFGGMEAFAAVPSNSGSGNGSKPAIVTSGLSKATVNGLKDLRFSDLFSGWSTYSVPFRFPNGPRETGPNLSLSYSSNAKDWLTPYGYGWSLSLSNISRSSRLWTDKTYSLDEYLLDGSEYVPDGIYYKARFATDATRLERNAGGWIVTDPTGVRRFYGTTSESRLSDPENPEKVFSWSIDRIELPSGEHVEYVYERDKGALYLVSVKWDFNAAGSALYETKLSYVAKPYSVASYRTNFAVQTSRLLSEVAFYSMNEKKRWYKMEYDDTETVNSHLLKVTEVTSEASLPSTQFEYGSGRFSHLLTKVTLPEGAVADLAYDTSALQRKPDGTPANPKLPMNLMVLTGVKVTEPVTWALYQRSFAYQDGYFYTDVADPFRREYAWFGKVTATEHAGEKTVSYFYQGRKDVAGDKLSKKGRPYRTEVFAPSGERMSLSIQSYAEIATSAGRTYVVPETSTSFDYGSGGTDFRSSAVWYAYDEFANVKTISDYGEVTADPNTGSFTDTWTDLLTTQLSYARDESRNILSLPSEKTVFSGTWTELRRQRTYYDGKELGQIWAKALVTTSEMLDPNGNAIRSGLAYDDLARLVSTTDPKGRITRYEPDAYGIYSEKTIDPKGFEYLSTYDYSLGAALSKTDPNGVVTIMSYDSFGRPNEERIKASNGAEVLLKKTVFQDNSIPKSVQVTDYAANGQRNSTIYYDGLGRAIQNRISAFEMWKSWVSDVEYDHRDLPVFASYPYQGNGFTYSKPAQRFAGVTTAYDTLGRAVATTDARGTSRQEYSPTSRTSIDRLWVPKTLVYDVRDRLTEVKEYASSGSVYSTKYEYTPLGQISRYTDAHGNTRNVSYDSFGRLVKLTDLVMPGTANVPAKTYEYDELGNLTKEIDQEGNSRQLTYDEIGRPVEAKFVRQDGLVDRTDKYEYDLGENAKGRIVKESNESYERLHGYNAFGLKSSETTTIRSWTNAKTYAHAFDYAPTGELNSLVYPDGYKVAMAYRDGFATAVNETASGWVVSQLASVLAYAPDGKPSKLSLGEWIVSENSFDPSFGYRLSAIKTVAPDGRIIQDLSYEYDNEDEITMLTEAAPHAGARKVAYSYDDLGRLTKASYKTLAGTDITAENYTYDAIGNMLSGPLGSYQYSTDITKGNPHAATQAGNLSMSYDQRGNLVALTENGNPAVTKGFRYDSAGRMTSSLNSSGSLEYGYKYDASNTRLLKRDIADNVLTFYPSDFYEESYDRDSANASTWTPATMRTTADRHVFFAGLRIATRQTVKTDAIGLPPTTGASSGSATTASGSGTTTETSTGSGGTESGTWTTSSGTTDTPAETSSGTTLTGSTETTSPVTESGSTASGTTETSGTDSGSTNSEASGSGSFSGAFAPMITSVASYEWSGSTSSWSTTTISSYPSFVERLVFHFTDHLGSASLDTDKAWNILSVRDYMPYGEHRIDESYQTAEESQANAKAYKNRYSFGNKERDDESGLRYFEARYYESRMGRFTSQDPVFWELGRTDVAKRFLMDPQQLNSYSFGRNNPIRFVDPTWMTSQPSQASNNEEEIKEHDATRLFEKYMMWWRDELQDRNFYSAKTYYKDMTSGDWYWNIKNNKDFLKLADNNGNVYIYWEKVSLSDLWNFLVGYNGYYAGMALNWWGNFLLKIYRWGTAKDIYTAGISVEKSNYQRFNPWMSDEALEKRALADEVLDRPWYDQWFEYAQRQEANQLPDHGLKRAIKNWNANTKVFEGISKNMIQDACWSNKGCYRAR